MTNDDTRLSRRMSLALRHRPDDVGITLDAAGWTDIAALAAALACGRDDVLRVVRTSDKRRFEISHDGTRIRAVQGHSVAVELGHPAVEPPERLFHGTVARFLESILANGLTPRARHDVHLSSSLETARAVAARRGTPVILIVASGAMARAGHAFTLAPNGVWLVGEVPPQFLAVLDEAEGDQG